MWSFSNKTMSLMFLLLNYLQVFCSLLQSSLCFLVLLPFSSPVKLLLSFMRLLGLWSSAFTWYTIHNLWWVEVISTPLVRKNISLQVRKFTVIFINIHMSHICCSLFFLNSFELVYWHRSNIHLHSDDYWSVTGLNRWISIK